jgi:aminoglycoside phosphotransferase (APT) family kinase protein
MSFSPASGGEGGMTKAELAAHYAEASGRRVDAIGWYECLALWKLAILLEGSFKRFREGTTEDPFFALLQGGVPRIAERALALTTRVEA